MDTIRTVVYDTVHTVVFDTVKVVLDSSFTPQVLRDSQTFYSWAFAVLVAVIGLGTGILAFVLNRLWDKKVTIAVDQLKQEFAQIADDKAERAAQKAADFAKAKFEKSFAELKAESLNLWREYVLDLFLKAKREINPVTSLSTLVSLMMKLYGRFEPELSGLVYNELLPEIGKRLGEAPLDKKYDVFLCSVKEWLQKVKQAANLKNFDKVEKSRLMARIDKTIAVVDQKIEEYSKSFGKSP